MISFPLVSAILLALLISHVLYRYFSNPLRRVPAAHPLAHFTSLWINYVRWRGLENRTLKAAHDRLGPIVCLGPEEISVNCVKGGIRDVYAGGFEKGNGKWNWYSFFTNYDGVDNMFSTTRNKSHSTRKRMLSNIYSKSVITSSPALLAQMSSIMYKRFLPRLDAIYSGPDEGVLDMYAHLSGTTMDIVTGYIFGLASSSNLIMNPKQLTWFLDLYNSRRSFNYWPQEHPRLTSWLSKIGIQMSPVWVAEANDKIENWTWRMCDSAAKLLKESGETLKSENEPVVYQQLCAALIKDAKKAGTETDDFTHEAASEVLDHLAAGFDTSGITLTYAIHELSKHQSIQADLRKELLTLSPPLIPSSAPTLPDPKAVDALPLLHAVVWETLRLHSAIPGPQPRMTPQQGCCLGPEEQSYFIPGGVRVSASAGILHANEEVYEEAGEWRPRRWLEDVDAEKRKDMESRWFWAFGSGGRMCVGSHLAVYQMKYIILALYSNYTTTIIDDAGIEQIDSYTAPPSSDKLMIKLSHVN